MNRTYASPGQRNQISMHRKLHDLQIPLERSADVDNGLLQTFWTFGNCKLIAANIRTQVAQPSVHYLPRPGPGSHGASNIFPNRPRCILHSIHHDLLDAEIVGGAEISWSQPFVSLPRCSATGSGAYDLQWDCQCYELHEPRSLEREER
jgi:hypothetical protein